ncbi:unnamed protein product [Allacma fusca]|uniref:Ig-like domain-containing protein n=1 Tax=Allacma fusca TaxID=39272 RepID=A0A8J2K659_9HEXA|nr:unnamed protein product [Allacma fusca]
MGRTVVNVFSMCNIAKTFPGVINYILISSCLIVLIASASATPAAGCTPTYHGEDLNADKSSRRIVIIEGSSFRMSCHLSKFNSVKWTLDGKELEHHLGRQLNVVVKTSETRHGEDIHTEIMVTNATRQHSGEYKCVSLCHSHNHLGTGDSNNGALLVVAFGQSFGVL